MFNRLLGPAHCHSTGPVPKLAKAHPARVPRQPCRARATLLLDHHCIPPGSTGAHHASMATCAALHSYPLRAWLHQDEQAFCFLFALSLLAPPRAHYSSVPSIATDWSHSAAPQASGTAPCVPGSSTKLVSSSSCNPP
jgi:hypothetical protein